MRTQLNCGGHRRSVGRNVAPVLTLFVAIVALFATPAALFAQCAPTTLPVQEGMSVATCSSVLDPGTSRVVVLYDTRNPAVNAPGLDTNWFAPQMHNDVPLSTDTWNRTNLGHVFGICLDDANNPNIYVTATQIWGLGVVGSAGSGGVYRLDGTTGAISTFASLPNTGPALGNIDHETLGGHFYVSNLDDGLIYHLDATGAAGATPTYDHGVDGIPGTANDIPDDGSIPLTQYGRRVWGLQVNEAEDRLYYGVWWENGTDTAGVDNEVWSVQLNAATRDPIPNTAQLEFTVPAINGRVHPITDITFDDTGTRMLIAQRTMSGNMLNNGAHQSSVLEYLGNTGGWVASATNKYYVGRGSGRNAAGGVDLDCEGNVWASGDYLHLSTGDVVYGMQRIPAAGGSTVAPYTQTSYLVDFDCNINDYGDKTLLGDVEHRRSACATCSIVDEEILCDPDVNGSYSYTFTVTNDSGVDADRIRLIPNGGFTVTPSTILQNIPDGTSASFTVQITGAAPGTTVCFEAWLMEDQFNQCCVIEHCIDLPNCCAAFEVISLDCDPLNPGNYILNFNVTNLSAIAVDRVFLWPTPPVAPGYAFGDDEFVSPADFAGPLATGGNTGPMTTTIIGGANGSTICFEVSVHDSTTGDCCFETICLTLPECDGCEDPDRCAVTEVKPCEQGPAGGEQAVINVRICNYCSDQETAFDWSIDGIIGASCPTPYLSPASFSPSTGVTPPLPRGECFEFAIVVDCTGIMPGDYACFEFSFTSQSTGLTTVCDGQVYRPGNVGGGGVDPIDHVIDVPVGEQVIVMFDVVHTGVDTPPTEAFLSESTNTISAIPGLSIEARPVGDSLTVPIDLPPGAMTTVAVSITIPVHDPLEIYTLYLQVDGDGDQSPDPILSANFRSVLAGDCNSNGLNDSVELALGLAEDLDGDGVIDGCQLGLPNFIRGDVNSDLGLDISDAVAALGYIFGNGSEPACLEAADVNADASVDIGDPITILGVLFSGGTPPSAPYPDCGAAPENSLGCQSQVCP